MADEPRGAEVAATRLCQGVRDAPLATAAELIPLTVTIGLARIDDGETLDAAIERADRALFEGKRGGRDRVVAAPQR